MQGKMMDILMVCTGNICRSPMAEGLLRQMLPQDGAPTVRVHSAGTHGLDDQPAATFAIQAAAEMGIDISGHRARSLDRDMVSKADLILVMEPFHHEIIARAVPSHAREKLQLLADFEKPRQSDTIDDPYHHSLKVYRACIHRIQHCLEGVVRHLESDRCPD
jgi:low molecular weight protein-tyrosine phosphatase